MKAIRNAILALTLIPAGVTSMTHPSAAQTPAQNPAQATVQSMTPTTTGVLVILTVKEGVTPAQIMAVMPDEVRQTVQLYLNGRIREWYSRGDGRGAVFLLDTRDVAEAHAIMDALPLGKFQLMDHDYIPLGPLMPLRLLMARP